jgi:head-tail adaptor
MSHTRARSITTAALMTVFVAGCGGSEPTAAPPAAPAAAARPTAPSSVTPSRPAASITGLSAQQIVKKARAAAKAAVSVRVRGARTTEDGTRLKLDVRVTRNAGSGTITYDGTEMKVIVVGRTAYVQGGDAFWRFWSQPSKAKDTELLVQRMRGKWLKVPLNTKAFGEMASWASKAALFDAMVRDPGRRRVRKTAVETIDGIPCVGVRGAHGTLWVNAANSRPARLELTGSRGTGRISFSEYQINEPTAPPAAQVVDGKALGL